MIQGTEPSEPSLKHGLVALLVGLGTASTMAQTSVSPSSTGGIGSDPSPYYLGASQAFTRDTNVYRYPFGPSDNYSSTSLLAGIDQSISRQRVFGTARVTLNRYQNETPLNNTSYEFNAGWDWQTIESLSGSVNATLQERLAYPTSNGVTPTQTRNMETHKGFDGVARWGGASLLTLEGRAGVSWVDYSAPEYQPSESRADVESLGLYYRPSGFWRFGIAGRLQRTDSPLAVLLPDGSRTGNVARSRNVDFLADYDGGSTLSGSSRISYTWQTNSGFNDSDFSGFTGSLDLRYRPTGKLAFTFSIARETGLDTGASLYNVGSVPGTSSLYQNNQVTASAVLGVSYAATAKINVGAYGHYSRSKLLASPVAGIDPTTIYDENRGVALSANYAYSRALSFACGLTRDRRIVTGPPSYAYDASTGSCSGQFLWR